MIKTLTPSNTAEILSRYRPIAPRPDPPAGGEAGPRPRQSPFLRKVWPQLQARPTRARKRGRTSALAPPVFKRQRVQPNLLNIGFSPVKSFSLHGFAHPKVQVQDQAQARARSPVTLPLLARGEEGAMDLSMHVSPNARVVPEEKDLLQQLLRPIGANNVISPKPVRPVCSVIRVERVNSISTGELGSISIPKTRAEVEEEVESEAVPVVISDSRNRVRMANSAYKEMVGQPECSWLGGGERIGGEVMIQLFGLGLGLGLDSAIGFSCWVKIEWGNDQEKKSCANAFCDVTRIACESKDYELVWRIRTQTRETASLSSSTNV